MVFDAFEMLAELTAPTPLPAELLAWDADGGDCFGTPRLSAEQISVQKCLTYMGV